jgi:pimeloyl-ACP methyl ester carboxylesterase
VGVDEHTIEVAGAPVYYRRVPGGDGEALYLHSVPTSSEDWLAPLELAGGVAPDLPGFGRSGKAGNLDYTLPGYVDFVGGFLDALQVDQVALVGHGWGAAIALMYAQRSPERVSRLAIVDAIPLLEGFTWPRVSSWWRRPGIGELIMGSTSRWLLARRLRAGAATADAWPDARIDSVWEHFDQGTQRAILRLHRSVDTAGLARAGAGLAELRLPTLIAWGEQDPWLAPTFADAYGRRLAGATVERVAGAGHWPWLDVPELSARLATFAAGTQPT